MTHAACCSSACNGCCAHVKKSINMCGAGTDASSPNFILVENITFCSHLKNNLQIFICLALFRIFMNRKHVQSNRPYSHFFIIIIYLICSQYIRFLNIIDMIRISQCFSLKQVAKNES